MKYAVIALIAALLLTACDPAPSPPNVRILPDDPHYSKETQAKAAAEMDAWCDKMPTICDIFMVDYSVMLKQLRAAKKILK